MPIWYNNKQSVKFKILLNETTQLSCYFCSTFWLLFFCNWHKSFVIKKSFCQTCIMMLTKSLAYDCGQLLMWHRALKKNHFYILERGRIAVRITLIIPTSVTIYKRKIYCIIRLLLFIYSPILTAYSYCYFNDSLIWLRQIKNVLLYYLESYLHTNYYFIA